MQVTNLGCGVDTRPFWLDCLKKVERYVEVDVETINTFKADKLKEVEEKSLCPRQVITMDFMTETIKDLPNHGYDKSLPTCWILEGLVMYLKKPEVT